MAINNNLTDFLTDVADAIREKTGQTGLINPQNFSTEIRSIDVVDITQTTAEADDVTIGKVFFNKDGVKTIGTLEIGSTVTIITDYLGEESLPQNPKENDVCILNAMNLRTWVYQNGSWLEYPIIVEEEVNEAGGTTLNIVNKEIIETLNEAGGTTLTIGG